MNDKLGQNMQPHRYQGMSRVGAHRQHGVALFIALVVLLIITFIGVAGLQGTRFEERMASNARDHRIAFQASESALRTAEIQLQALPANFVASFDANGAGRFRPAAVADPPRWESVDWKNDNTIPSVDVGTTDLRAVAGQAQPKFIIEYMAQVAFQQDVNNQGGYGEGEPELSDVFRVTAYGTGGSADARVLLQSTFGKVAQ